MILDNIITPEEFGAIGNGIQDDTDALVSAVNTNKTVYLSPQAVYLINSSLILNPKQIILGNNSKLIRKPQFVTQALTSIVKGITNTVELNSVIGLTIGSRLSFSSGSLETLVAEKNLSTNNVKVINIEGNIITLEYPPNCSLPALSDVWTSYYTIVLKDNCKVQDIVIEGNINNYSIYRWETVCEIKVAGNNCVVNNIFMNNIPGEGIILTGNYNKIENCYVNTANGNAVHLSASIFTDINSFTAINCNLDPRIGHSDGALIASELVSYTNIQNCFIQKCKSGISSFDTINNSRNIFRNNTIKNCSNYGISTIYCTGNIIEGNYISDCASGGICGINIPDCSANIYANNILVNNHLLLGGNAKASSIIVNGNQLINCSIKTVSALGKSNIYNNNITNGNIDLRYYVCNSILENNIIDNTQSTVTDGIKISGQSTNSLNIKDNTIIGCNNGITLNNKSSDITISNNLFSNQASKAININYSLDSSGSIISDNIINVISNTPIGNYFAIYSNLGLINIVGNTIINRSTLNIPFTAIYMAKSKSIIKDNIIKGNFTDSIKLATTSYYNIVKNNIINKPINNFGINNQDIDNLVFQE